jgi:hypothetical protein
MAHADMVRQRPLQGRNLGSQDELAVRQHPGNRRLDAPIQAPVLGREIDQGEFRRLRRRTLLEQPAMPRNRPRTGTRAMQNLAHGPERAS